MLDDLQPAKKVEAPKDFRAGWTLTALREPLRLRGSLSHLTLMSSLRIADIPLMSMRLSAPLERHSGNAGMGCG